MSFDAFREVYRRGFAVGFSDVKTERMTFRWEHEVFEFPADKVFGLAKWNGCFYECAVEDLRKLEAEEAAPDK